MYNKHIKENQISVSHPTLTYLSITKSQASKFKEYTRYYSKFLTFIDDIVRLVSVFESYVMNVNLSEDTNLKHLKFCKIWKHKRYRKYFQQNINLIVISPNLDCKCKYASIDNLQDIPETFGSKKTPYEHIKEIQSLLSANSK